MADQQYIRIKAINEGGQWVLEVLSAPYGGHDNGKDAHGEYFSPNTNFYENEGAPLPLVAYYHGYTPDGDPDGDPEIIGRAVKVWRTAAGLWHRVVLDPTKELARRVWEAAQEGRARASTGAAGHMARTLRTGEITHWLIGELSLFDVDGDRQPANQYAVVHPATKRLLKDAGFLPDSQGDATGDEQGHEPESDTVNESDTTQEGRLMADELNNTPAPDITAQVQAQVKAALEADRKEREVAEAAAKAEAERTDAAIKAAREEWEAENASNRRLPSDGAPNVAKFGNVWKYDNLDDGDLAFALHVMDASGQPKSENMLKALALRATQDENERSMSRVRAQMVQQGIPVKANELNQSTLANYGDDWVGVAYSRQLWERVNDEATIVPNIPTVEVPQGSESVTIPLQSTPPTFYKVAQASAQDTNTLGKVTYTHTSSKMGTANQSLTVGKMGARAIYTGELDEDSLIMWAPELRGSIELEAANVLDSLVIDGDTATGATTNINDIAGTPGGTEYWLVANGFRKLALVTNTANSRSAGTLTVDDFLETVKLMGAKGKNAVDKTKVAFILDLPTHWKALQLTEVRSRDVFSSPTIENGSLTGIWGYRILTTPNMHRPAAGSGYEYQTNSAGKIDQDTDSNNAYGAILAVRWDQWRLGWKRRLMFETIRVPQADATEIVVNMRVGLIYRDTEASAISYGVTV